MALRFSDEYTVTFEKKPFGMVWGSRKSDRNNLYVTGIEPDSPAFLLGVKLGSKLIKLGEQHVENLGAKEVFWHFKKSHDADEALPLSITFRNPKEAQLPKRPSSGITRSISIHQNFLGREEIAPIRLPVDCGEEAMKLSSPSRLQENFIAVLHYMAGDKNTQDDWVAFLSRNEKEIMRRFASTTVCISRIPLIRF